MSNIIVENQEKDYILKLYNTSDLEVIDEQLGALARRLIGKNLIKGVGKKFFKGAVAGWKKTPWSRQILSKLLTGQWRDVGRYLMGMPLRRGSFKVIRKTLGLGPAIASVGGGLLKQYIGIMISLSVIRGTLMLMEKQGFSSISQVNEYFNIPKYKDYGEWYENIFHNLLKSGYLPDIKVLFRGLTAVPWLLSNMSNIFSYLGSVLNSVFDPDDSDKTFFEALISSGEHFDNEKQKIEGQFEEIPSDLLSLVLSNQRSNIKIDDENGVYWTSPEYQIQKLGGIYAVLIPGDGWYNIKDVK